MTGPVTGGVATTQPAIWAQSLHGRAIDLVRPRPEDVDFGEISSTLARVMRWTGASRVPVSVGWHTLLGVHVARAAMLHWAIPHWLLHDAHEAYIGDIATPVAGALAAVAGELSGQNRLVTEALAEMKLRHDVAIHAAANLPMPDGQTRAAIKSIDAVTMMWERRDYLTAPPRPWAAALEALTPPADRARVPPPHAAVEEILDGLFRRYLPALGGDPKADSRS